MTSVARTADAKIRAVARLRDLCRRLPHIPTEAEQQLLERFQLLERAPTTARADDLDALAAGWGAWWRVRRSRDIASMAAALPPGLIDADRRLATYALAAQLACGANVG